MAQAVRVASERAIPLALAATHMNSAGLTREQLARTARA